MMFCRGKRLSLPLPLTSRYCTTCSDPPKATSFDLGVEDGFHKINLSYPGLQLVRRCPHIFLVQNFFSSTECQRLLHKAAYEPESMKPAGVFTRDGHNRLPVRTSSQCICPQAEVPALIRKIVALPDCTRRQLEACQIIRYQEGEFFKLHGDYSTSGTRSSAGFVNSSRLATLFVYLNDIQQGGETEFPNASPPLKISPKQGLAVLHFPARLDRCSDARRTRHQSLPAIDEKWIFATWLWSEERSSDAKTLHEIGRGYTHVWPESYDTLSPDAALHLLESMSGCRLRPDVVSCNSVLTSCGRGFEWRRAVQLLRTMQTLEEPRPDLVSFNTALAAVANSFGLRV
ncbi:P4H1 [Symbiodinium necroappetens]|uniref:P4H1 protein n=1 Tax=Symbiodinium necroappetens TaxID=1628268 RepID=A0A812ZFG4_9DINO|nr:P4H1 [Symbiodinium necroappetens]